MNVAKSNLTIKKLSTDILREWSQIPPAIAGDCMNRQNVMASKISPIKEGDVLVVEGGEFLDRAIWGGIMNRVAIIQNLGGIVIDGAISDISELKEMTLPVFASGSIPAGPTKGGGGFIDIPISCGNVSVSPGDIIVGDDDGVTVIPLKRSEKILNATKKLIIMENQIDSRLENGELHKDIFNIDVIPLTEDLD